MKKKHLIDLQSEFSSESLTFITDSKSSTNTSSSELLITLDENKTNAVIDFFERPPPKADKGTTGIITLAKQCYHPKYKRLIQEYYLCSDLDHFRNFGNQCGFRNFQMFCSSLIRFDVFKKALFGGTGQIPDVLGLQQLLEKAWSNGFDPQGFILYPTFKEPH